jgi:predicted RNA polymerase sigma factor
MKGSEIAARTHLDTSIQLITDFLEEIETEKYETIAQVRGALFVQLDVNEKAKKSFEYEVAARLDNLTGGNNE